jgi:ABC-type branched-subunit amino acid transport system ATPase component
MRLEVQGMVAGYGRTEVVQDVSFTVNSGEILGVIGHNGAGKSTVVKAVGGLARVFAGRLRLGEQDITGLRPHQMMARGVAMVGQGQDIFPDLTVEENILMGGYLLPARRRGERLRHCLALFPAVYEKRKAKAGTLSGGQRQQLKIARSLMTEPTLVLVDEPSAGLSPLMRDAAFRMLRELRDQHGLSVLLVEQNVAGAVAVADRILVMQAGRVRRIVRTSDIGVSVDLRELVFDPALAPPTESSQT